ncbi:zinc finger protein RFP-like [Sceloporus undulatus]|uniref:zinc finger protein RFP-like n=1 Tax=Sceloporus undulatus TaxID=8520 RepID=UPI001C4D504E|nr:zinc finger protein RFP-like [Sceloporus undulatus]
MASTSPWRSLQREATCPSCQDYFTEPMFLDCGHNLCFRCVANIWSNPQVEIRCPRCMVIVQPENFKPNLQLASMVQIAKMLSKEANQEAAGGKRCEKHQEPLKLFCKEDKSPICLICDRSKQHQEHQVVPIVEAGQEYKDQIHNYLKNLKKERQQILAYKADTQNESQFLLKQIKAERGKTKTVFRQLYQFLEEHEKFLLAKMEEVEKEIMTKRDEHLAKLSGELLSLQSLIQDMEENSQQLTSEIFQDIGRILRRCHRREKFEKTVVFPPTLKWEIWDFCDFTPFLVGVMEQFKDSLVFGLQSQIAHVTLDPDTAHPQLFLSQDLKSVQYRSKAQVLPSHPERFNEWESVLGLKGFATGRYFWEVTVGSEEAWAIGVARKTVKRKGVFDLGPQEGIWAMGKFEGNYRGINVIENPVLFLDRMPKRIRITLNCEGGRVAFFNASTAALLFTFPAASFARQTLHPWFWLCKKKTGHTVSLRVETVINKFAAVATTQM